VGQILRLYGKSQQETDDEAILLIEPVLHLNKSQANEVAFHLQNKFMYITMIFKVLLYESVNLLIRGSLGFKAYAK
jgi:predicted glycosyltransferase involved in capsule biosynthesis